MSLSNNCTFNPLLKSFSIHFLVGLRQFYSQKLPSVPQQCSSQNIISSLLFKDFTFPESIAPNPSWHLSKNKPEWESTSTITTSNISMKNEPKVLQESNLQAETLSKKDILIQEVQRKQEETDTIINEIKTMKNKLEQVGRLKNETSNLVRLKSCQGKSRNGKGRTTSEGHRN